MAEALREATESLEGRAAGGSSGSGRPSEAASTDKMTIELLAQELQDLKVLHEEKIKESEEQAEQLLRLQAEFENYKRRTTREKAELGGFAQAILIEKLLPALDDLDRAAEAVAGEDTPAVQGFLLVRDKMRRALTEAGLERIAAAGQTFDPNLHEALLTEPVEDHRAGQVLEELVAGYTFKGNVVRHARVKVGMASSD